MSQMPLRLTPSPFATDPRETAGAPHRRDVLHMERRRTERHGHGGRVTALSDARTDGVRGRICSLQLLNLSDSGAAGLAAEPLAVGSRITMFFPPHGPERGFDAFGEVVRCRPFEHGHEMGIRFDVRPAA